MYKYLVTNSPADRGPSETRRPYSCCHSFAGRAARSRPCRQSGSPAFAVPSEDPEKLARLSGALALVCCAFGRALETLSASRLGRDHHQQALCVLAVGGIADGGAIGNARDSGGSGPDSYSRGTRRAGDRAARPRDNSAAIPSVPAIDESSVSDDDHRGCGFCCAPVADHQGHAALGAGRGA